MHMATNPSEKVKAHIMHGSYVDSCARIWRQGQGQVITFQSYCGM